MGVCWWAAGLTVLYFIVGAFLKSDGPNFDPAKTYDLIKDTLTLTATFLAPVAAFVLFSDWREQHEAQSIESDSTDVFNGLNVLEDKLLNLNFAIDDEDFKTEMINQLMSEIADKAKVLKLLNSQIGARENGKKFAACADEIITEIMTLNLELSQLSSYKIKMLNPEKFNEYEATTPEQYAEHIETRYYTPLNYQITRNYPKLNHLKSDLSELCNELKIKA